MNPRIAGSCLTAWAVAVAAGVGQTMLWESTLVGLIYVDQYTHVVSLVVGTLSPIAAPLVVLSSGYALTRFVGDTRFAVPMTGAFFFGGVVGSVVTHLVVLRPLWSSLVYYPTPVQALLAHFGSAIATGLYVCVAGIAGIGWWAIRHDSPAPPMGTADSTGDTDANATPDSSAGDAGTALT